MNLRYKMRTRRVLLLLTYVALTCKLLIPAGYMPAAVGDGWPVRMCASGLPEALLPDDGNHRDHGDTDDGRWDYCVLGDWVSATAVTIEHALQIPYLGDRPAPAVHDRISTVRVLRAFHSRAPPTSMN